MLKYEKYDKSSLVLEQINMAQNNICLDKQLASTLNMTILGIFSRKNILQFKAFESENGKSSLLVQMSVPANCWEVIRHSKDPRPALTTVALTPILTLILSITISIIYRRGGVAVSTTRVLAKS